MPNPTPPGLGERALAPPRLVAWETTRACNLVCRHCRAEAVTTPPPGELSPSEGQALLHSLAEWDPGPIIILSGGEPLLRPDIFELAELGKSLGLRMVLSTNGTLLDSKVTAKIKKAGIQRLSLSLDGPDPTSHDTFRGVQGSYALVKESAKLLQESGIPFQINTTLTPGNLKESSKILEVAISWGACAHHVFLLVPVGRALDLERDSFSAVEYEKVLRDLKARESQLTVEFKATCAPQYQRIGKELGYAQRGKGCLGGKGFMFVSSHGLVQACGYLPQVAGDIRQNHPREIYQNSQLFLKLRSRKYYQGKCGVCEYWAICGGCRARAQAEGNFLGEEPLCPYQPKGFADYNPQKTAEILK